VNLVLETGNVFLHLHFGLPVLVLRILNLEDLKLLLFARQRTSARLVTG